jgi:hypothetical protein
VTFSETEDETWRPESVIVLREGQNETLFDLSVNYFLIIDINNGMSL